MEDILADSDAMVHRNRPGTKSKAMNRWPDIEFDDMDSILCVQQIIQQRIKDDASNIQVIINPPPSQDEDVWKYEHIRQFCQELNGLAVLLQAECNPTSCPQMMATEQWIYLCAAHKIPKECPAIDYTRHTLDGAAVLLNSNKYFSSRVTIKDTSVAKLASVCRRLYRIFSHAFYHHRAQFDIFETETFLCERFTAFAKKYELMTGESLIVTLNHDSNADSEGMES
ncbi:uncharacterized protein TRIADDRAFT_22476 [Trichoplax adhaerens]|uniref:Uncharacterized protein n=1 Tax=Trichoplax adhaerens TaxID=10228 RepID=B3RQP7_TRIAD|nr:hypothetical protein TRIADDRAFT_22476 [Trichoplax adhaerens]EDV26733.1 hypothetical protein TRIADDRAFT_22476 [Trichoplax adhaerens]|eukprot:XP_002110729.1 hypothetical protein TRIADDRAFT_22476 [Trichoplax adhaerens]